MMKVLIIDDDKEFLEETAEMIEAGGYSSRTADNAGDALDAAETFDPDLIILDLKMPGNGRALARHLREGERTRDIPIIIISGRIDDGDRDVLSGEMGITTFLEKPVNPLDLIAAIEFHELGGEAAGGD